MALIKVVDGEDYLNIKLWMRRASDGGWLRGQKYDLLYQYRYVGMTETDARVQAAADRAAGREAQVRRSHACGFFEVSVTELTEGIWEVKREEDLTTP
jgi:hypothetical protein